MNIQLCNLQRISCSINEVQTQDPLPTSKNKRTRRHGRRVGKGKKPATKSCEVPIKYTCIKPLNGNIKFCMLNTRSVRNKTTEFVDFVLENNFDIVALCESWIKPDDNIVIDDITPCGYCFKHVPRPGSKRGGGVALQIGPDCKSL